MKNFLGACSGEVNVCDEFLGTLGGGGGGGSLRALVGVSLKVLAGEDQGDKICVGELFSERHLDLPVKP